MPYKWDWAIKLLLKVHDNTYSEIMLINHSFFSNCNYCYFTSYWEIFQCPHSKTDILVVDKNRKFSMGNSKYRNLWKILVFAWKQFIRALLAESYLVISYACTNLQHETRLIEDMILFLNIRYKMFDT